ncbi:MAG: M20/M25/M40 family metallo-hydrolase, partial [Clostridia bacterium]|nr:M20/M25/M40 family metallo-hydrolase [Clostridia bacterium]
LDRFAAMCRREGFSVVNSPSDSYLLAVWEPEHYEGTLGLFSHLDVVAAGNDWDITAPFSPLIMNDFLFGRGVSDDKSGAVISLYILKMVRDLNLAVKSRVLLFAGINEESGMVDMDDFVKEQPIPDFSLVLDTAFPLYHGNKSILTYRIRFSTPFEEILSFSGGLPSGGAVAGQADAELPDSDDLYESLTQKTTDRLHLMREHGHIILHADGVSTHGALPEGSLNAGYLLADALADCPVLCQHDRAIMKKVKEMLGRYYGEFWGIEHTDDFGKTTCVCTYFTIIDGQLNLSFNVRFGWKQTAEKIKTAVRRTAEDCGCTVSDMVIKQGYYISPDNPYVTALLDEYRNYTGNMSAKGVLNAGGTYARKLSGKGVETGTWLWRRPAPPLKPGHGHVHQPDEFIDIDGFTGAAELNARMLFRADRVLHGEREHSDE